MKTLTAVAAMDENHALGSRGRIPWRIASEFAHFREYTMGKTLIMGRRTFESIGNPLPGRTTFVVSSTEEPGERENGVHYFASLEDALEASPQEEVIIAGGSQIYSQCMGILDRMVLSTVPLKAEEADTYFPTWNTQVWYVVSREDRGEFIVNTWERRRD